MHENLISNPWQHNFKLWEPIEYHYLIRSIVIALELYTKFVIVLLGSWHSPIVGSTMLGKKFEGEFCEGDIIIIIVLKFCFM
jgi:hypothetical protein